MSRMRWLFLLVAVLFVASLQFLGCTTIKSACEACCKAQLKEKERRGFMSSQEAYWQIEPCVNDCTDRAEDDFRDGAWVERNQACK